MGVFKATSNTKEPQSPNGSISSRASRRSRGSHGSYMLTPKTRTYFSLKRDVKHNYAVGHPCDIPEEIDIELSAQSDLDSKVLLRGWWDPLYCWMGSCLRIARTRCLEEDDLPPLPLADQVASMRDPEIIRIESLRQKRLKRPPAEREGSRPIREETSSQAVFSEKSAVVKGMLGGEKVEEKFPQENFRVFSEMRTLAKIKVSIKQKS